MILYALIFALSFLGLIAIGTLVVGGWFFTTRGRITVLPDGTQKKEGKLFKFVYFYFMQELPAEKIYYRGDELTKVASQMEDNLLRSLQHGARVIVHPAAISIQLGGDDAKKTLKREAKQLGVSVLDKGDGYYALYKEYPQYLFPEWVRDPLVKCATCFSSFYGSLFYWSTYPFIGKHLYSWMEMPILASALLFWVIFCFSLAIPLTALAKKYN
jgi:hypothetical protein